MVYMILVCLYRYHVKLHICTWHTNLKFSLPHSNSFIDKDQHKIVEISVFKGLEDTYFTCKKRLECRICMTKHTDTYNTNRGFRQVCLSLKVPIILLLMFLTKKNHVFFLVVFYFNSCFLDLLLHYSWLEMVKTVAFDFQFCLCRGNSLWYSLSKELPAHEPNICWLLLGLLTSKAEKSSFNP